MWCAYCGKELADGMAFCPHCGKPVTKRPEAPKSEPPKPEPPKQEPAETEAPQPKDKPSSGGGRLSSGLFDILMRSDPLFTAVQVMLLCMLLGSGLAHLQERSMVLLVLAILVLAVLDVFWLVRMDQTMWTSKYHREWLDTKNIAYPMWRHILQDKAIAPVEVRGFLRPGHLSRKAYPAKNLRERFAMTTMKQYYFPPKFWESTRLAAFWTGRRFIWEVLSIVLVQLVFLPLGGTILSVIFGFTCFMAIHYCVFYYPGLVHMSCTPHLLPLGIEPQEAERRILMHLANRGISVTWEGSKALVMGQYPLEITKDSFHIGFPANAEENHKNQYLEELAQLNCEAAEALFPDRMQMPLLPVVDAKTRYTIRERYLRVAMAFLAGAIVLAGVVLGFNFLGGPAKDIQQTVWEKYSDTVTLGDAFEEHFQDISWENNTYDDDPYVTFSGEILTENLHMDVKMLFRYLEQEETYYLVSATVNDVAMSDYGMNVLLQYGFDGDTDALVENLMADQILDAIFDGYW